MSVEEIISRYPNKCLCKDNVTIRYPILGCPIHGIQVYRDIQTLLFSLERFEKQEHIVRCEHGHRHLYDDTGCPWCRIKQKKEQTEYFRLEVNRLTDMLAKKNGEKFQAEERVRELEVELKEGDYWMQRTKGFLSNGGCPVCFTTDEEGHKEKCEWGMVESRLKNLVEAVEKCKNKISTTEWNLAILEGDFTKVWQALEELYKVLEEVKGDIKDYTSPNLLVEQLTERIKELEAELDREITYKEALEQAEEKIKELENLIPKDRDYLFKLINNLTQTLADCTHRLSDTKVRIKELEDQVDFFSHST